MSIRYLTKHARTMDTYSCSVIFVRLLLGILLASGIVENGTGRRVVLIIVS